MEGRPPPPRPPQALLRDALDLIARSGRGGCTMENVWTALGVAPQDVATRRFLWRAIRGQKHFLLCELGEVLVRGEGKKRQEITSKRLLSPADLDARGDAVGEVLVIASNEHRLRALGGVCVADMPEEGDLHVLEIVAQAYRMGLANADLEAELKGRGLQGINGAFLVDRLVAQGHICKAARAAPDNSQSRQQGNNRRVLLARLPRFALPLTAISTEDGAGGGAGILSLRMRTGDRVVDHARGLLLTELGRELGQAIAEHYAGIYRTRPRPVDAPLEAVARLLRLDGPSARALVLATLHRDFDDRSPLRAIQSAEGEEGEGDAAAAEADAAAAGRGWLLRARPSRGGAGEGGAEEEGEEAVTGPGPGEEWVAGPYRRRLPMGTIQELDELRQIYRLVFLRREKGLTGFEVMRAAGMPVKRVMRHLALVTSNPQYGVRAVKATHGRTAAYRLFAPGYAPGEEEVGAAGGAGGGDVMTVATNGAGGGAGGAAASRGEDSAFRAWHRALTGVRRRRMEVLQAAVLREGCVVETELFRMLREDPPSKGGQMDRKSLRRLLAELEAGGQVRLLALNNEADGKPPSLVVANAALDPQGPELQRLMEAVAARPRRALAFRASTYASKKQRGRFGTLEQKLRAQQRAGKGKGKGKGGERGGKAARRKRRRRADVSSDEDEDEETEETEESEEEYEGESEEGEEGGEGEEAEAEEAADAIADKKVLHAVQRELQVLQGPMQRVQYFHDLLWRHAQRKRASSSSDEAAAAAAAAGEGGAGAGSAGGTVPIDLAEMLGELSVAAYVRVFGLFPKLWTHGRLALLKQHARLKTPLPQLPPELLESLFAPERLHSRQRFLRDLISHLLVLRLAAGQEEGSGSLMQGRYVLIEQVQIERDFKLRLPGAGGGGEGDDSEDEEELEDEESVKDPEEQYPWEQRLGTLELQLDVALDVERPGGKKEAASAAAGPAEAEAEAEADEDAAPFSFQSYTFNLRPAPEGEGQAALRRYWETLKVLALGQRAPPTVGAGSKRGRGGEEGEGEGEEAEAEEESEGLMPGIYAVQLQERVTQLLPHIRSAYNWTGQRERARKPPRREGPKKAARGGAGERRAKKEKVVLAPGETRQRKTRSDKGMKRGPLKVPRVKVAEDGAAASGSNKAWRREGEKPPAEKEARRAWRRAAVLVDELRDQEAEADEEGQEQEADEEGAATAAAEAAAASGEGEKEAASVGGAAGGEGAGAMEEAAEEKDEESGAAATGARRRGPAPEKAKAAAAEEAEMEAAAPKAEPPPTEPPLEGRELDEVLMECYVRQRAAYGSGARNTPQYLLEPEEQGAPAAAAAAAAAGRAAGKAGAEDGAEELVPALLGGEAVASRARRFRMQWAPVVQRTRQKRMTCLRRLEVLLREPEASASILARLRQAEREGAEAQTGKGNRLACYSRRARGTPLLGAALAKVKQTLLATEEAAAMEARRQALEGLPAGTVRRAFRELWDDGWLLEGFSVALASEFLRPDEEEEDEDGAGGEEEEDEEGGGRRRGGGRGRAGRTRGRGRSEDGDVDEDEEDEEEDEEGEGAGEDGEDGGSTTVTGSRKRRRRRRRAAGGSVNNVLTLAKRFDEAIGRATSSVFTRAFFRSVGPSYPQDYDEADVMALPSGAVCRLVEAFALTHAALPPRTPRAGAAGAGGGQLLDLVLPPASEEQVDNNNLRGFVTDPLPDVGVAPVVPEALELAAELPPEVTRDALTILATGQEAWGAADAGEYWARRPAPSPPQPVSEQERRLCARVVAVLGGLGGASGGGGGGGNDANADADADAVAVAADGLSFPQLVRHPAVRAERPPAQDERAFRADLRAALVLAVEVDRAVARVPGFFGPRFVAAAHAGPWRMAAEGGEEKERLALPWLRVKDGRLHGKLLVRLLRALVVAVQNRPGLALLDLQQEFLPVLSFSELLVLLRACQAAGVLSLVHVEAQAPGLFGETRRDAQPCPGPECRYFDDVDVEGAAVGEEQEEGEWAATVAAIPQRNGMTQYGLLEMAIRATARSGRLVGDGGLSPIKLPVRRKRPRLIPVIPPPPALAPTTAAKRARMIPPSPSSPALAPATAAAAPTFGAAPAAATAAWCNGGGTQARSAAAAPARPVAASNPAPAPVQRVVVSEVAEV